MAARTRIKLVKVMDGLYRSESGNVRIARQDWARQEVRWEATWKDWMNQNHVVHGRTLKEVISRMGE